MFFFFFSKPYISIIGELIIDKKTNRNEALLKLTDTLNSLNSKYEDNMTAKFMPTIHYEFQGLICEGEKLLPILLELKNKMHPVKIRFGIGIGEIETESISELSISVKGPGYEKAREALHFLQELSNKKQSILADVRIETAGEKNEKLGLINTIFSLLTTIEYSWSDRQREIIYNMIQYDEKQSGVAKKLGITQSTVQKSLAAGKYYTYKDALQTLRSVFYEIGEKS